MRDGRIAAIGEALDAAGAEVVAVRGRWVTPGLMNAHAHACLDGGPDPETVFTARTRTAGRSSEASPDSRRRSVPG